MPNTTNKIHWAWGSMPTVSEIAAALATAGPGTVVEIITHLRGMNTQADRRAASRIRRAATLAAVRTTPVYGSAGRAWTVIR